MKANNNKTVFKDLKTLKPLRQQIKPQQAPLATGVAGVPVNPSATQKPPVVHLSDQDLFLQAVKDVKPLKSTRTASHQAQTKRKKDHAFQNEQFKRRQQHALGQTQLSHLQNISDFYSPDYDETPRRDYLSPLCGPDVLRHLKKERWAIVSSIDLHGATLDQARLRLAYFLQHSLAENYKCVRVVHGIGYGSKDSGPVLPTAVRRWLTQFDFVLAYTDCSPREGGKGAVKMLLRTHAPSAI